MAPSPPWPGSSPPYSWWPPCQRGPGWLVLLRTQYRMDDDTSMIYSNTCSSTATMVIVQPATPPVGGGRVDKGKGRAAAAADDDDKQRDVDLRLLPPSEVGHQSTAPVADSSSSSSSKDEDDLLLLDRVPTWSSTSSCGSTDSFLFDDDPGTATTDPRWVRSAVWLHFVEPVR